MHAALLEGPINQSKSFLQSRPQALAKSLLSYLTTIGGPWYFDRAVVPQRLINQSLYQEILLLQKFIDISGKVLKLKKIQPPTSEKKNEAVFYFLFFLNWDFDLEISQLRKKVFMPTSKM